MIFASKSFAMISMFPPAATEKKTQKTNKCDVSVSKLLETNHGAKILLKVDLKCLHFLLEIIPFLFTFSSFHSRSGDMEGDSVWERETASMRNGIRVRGSAIDRIMSFHSHCSAFQSDFIDSVVELFRRFTHEQFNGLNVKRPIKKGRAIMMWAHFSSSSAAQFLAFALSAALHIDVEKVVMYVTHTGFRCYLYLL